MPAFSRASPTILSTSVDIGSEPDSPAGAPPPPPPARGGAPPPLGTGEVAPGGSSEDLGDASLDDGAVEAEGVGSGAAEARASSGSAVVGAGLDAAGLDAAGLDAAGLAETEASAVGEAVGKAGDMGTNSASPKSEADCDAFASSFSLSFLSSSPPSSFGVSGWASVPSSLTGPSPPASFTPSSSRTFPARAISEGASGVEGWSIWEMGDSSPWATAVTMVITARMETRITPIPRKSWSKPTAGTGAASYSSYSSRASPRAAGWSGASASVGSTRPAFGRRGRAAAA